MDLNNDGNFTDPGEAGYLTATVNGGTATFTFTSPLPDGTYHLRARVSDQADNQGLSAVSTMVVATAPASVALTPPVAMEEVPLNNVLVGHFGFFGSGNYTATITWGDGTTFHGHHRGQRRRATSCSITRPTLARASTSSRRTLT